MAGMKYAELEHRELHPPDTAVALSTRVQIAVVARLRYELFRNSLHTFQGNMELFSGAMIALFYAVGGLGAGFGLGTAAWYFTWQHREDSLALLLWPIFLFWQLFPIMAAAYAENLDATSLLRFPLTYRAYVLIRLAYGSLEPSTFMVMLWLLGILLGIGVAKPALLPWAAFVLLAFALTNILLTRMIFAWIECWLGQRRSREILAVLFFLGMISFQVIGPAVGRSPKPSHSGLKFFLVRVTTVQKVLPPGLAADAIRLGSRGHIPSAIGALGLCCVYGLMFFWVLHMRLCAQYRGENLSETVASRGQGEMQPQAKAGWPVCGLAAPVAANFEKELRYLSRSGPMLLTLIMPVFMLLVFRLGPAARYGFLMRTPALAFPVGAAYMLLMLTNLIYNSFGGEGTGIQFLFASPARFRQILLGKNLAHITIFLLEVVLVWAAGCLLYRPPTLEVTITTLSAVLFAAPLNVAAGNLLSIYSPKKIEYGTFGRQRASHTTVLASFAIQLSVFGLSALVLLLSRPYGDLWLAALVFLALAGPAFLAYFFVLNRVDKIALERRENLIAELGRA
jgi:ABC-2 type transport system permease protein